MTINQENAKIAAELGIPHITKNAQQRGYSQIHFRRCIKYLEWICIINAILIVIVLYLFFSRPKEVYYATSFDGKNTLIPSFLLANANAITQQNKLPQGMNP